MLDQLLQNPRFANAWASMPPAQQQHWMQVFGGNMSSPSGPGSPGPAGGPDPVGPQGGGAQQFTPTDPRSLQPVGPSGAYGWDAYRRQARGATEGMNRMPFVFGEYGRVPQDRAQAHALFYPPELQNFNRQPSGGRREIRGLLDALMASQEAGMGGFQNPVLGSGFREMGG